AHGLRRREPALALAHGPARGARGRLEPLVALGGNASPERASLLLSAGSRIPTKMTDDPHDRSSRPRSASDVPLDLVKEREVFVRSFLKKGVEYTEHLLKENDELRDELLRLRDDNARLRAQVASDDAIRDLLRTVEALEKERRDLVERSERLEATRREDEGRQAEIEQEVNDLANLYIASYQLHASLSVRRVVRHLRDMCGQLVGALGFVIYIV